MKYKALDISKYFIELASTNDENDLTNLKLQKILYFAQGKHIAFKGSRLFDEEIEAWDLGPVVKSVYDTFKVCGKFPITLFDLKYSHSQIDNKTKKFLSGVWDEYSKFSASYLVDKTHDKGSPWYKAFLSSKKIILDEDLKSFFKK